jgi:hypothetical protein
MSTRHLRFLAAVVVTAGSLALVPLAAADSVRLWQHAGYGGDSFTPERGTGLPQDRLLALVLRQLERSRLRPARACLHVRSIVRAHQSGGRACRFRRRYRDQPRGRRPELPLYPRPPTRGSGDGHPGGRAPPGQLVRIVRHQTASSRDIVDDRGSHCLRATPRATVSGCHLVVVCMRSRSCSPRPSAACPERRA